MSVPPTARSLFIITGASRGFGRSIALAIADSPLVTSQPTDIILTSRSLVDLTEVKVAVERTFEEADVARRHQLNLNTCAVDFTSSNLDTICDFIVSRSVPEPPSAYTTVVLFNNAGTLGTLSRIRDQTMLDAILVNVSSLAAVQPFDTWGVYSSVKAARDMLHRVIAVEEANIEMEGTLPGFATRPHPEDAQDSCASPKSARVRVLNYAPGPMDTDMQTRIRTEMPEVELKQAYIKMHAEGQLVDPNDSARVLVSMLESDDYENGAHVDFYDVQEQAGKGLVGK
ncbi:hypothetical protein BASA62_009047 [Batrachochytrium salamandrivorans]|nr:hypothetical protein BASA62_009047 [Batrachochytrium salamandrivorans]